PRSTGPPPPPSTGSGPPGRWWRRRWPACPRRTGPTSSPRAAWSGIRPTGPRRPGGSARRPASGPGARPPRGGRGGEGSLRRRRVERIDLYQMHWPAEDGTPLEEYWQVFTNLKREGKIRAAGLSNHGIFQLEAAEEIGTVDAIQPPFSLIHRDAADDVLVWDREQEAGAIVYSPMASGLLTGAFTAGRAAALKPG